MRETIEKILGGDDAQFETLIKSLVEAKILVFAQAEGDDGLTVNFLNYLLEDDQDIEYIPVFTDEAEVNEFVADADVPAEYEIYEFDGDSVRRPDGQPAIHYDPPGHRRDSLSGCAFENVFQRRQ